MDKGARQGWVRYLGFVPEADLPLLYAGAALFVYPSVYEGFGLPPVEADGLADVTQQVIVSGTPATLVEAVGEKTASYSVFHPVGNATWFYKISGPSEAVTRENAAFRAFLESIQFPK